MKLRIFFSSLNLISMWVWMIQYSIFFSLFTYAQTVKMLASDWEIKYNMSMTAWECDKESTPLMNSSIYIDICGDVDVCVSMYVCMCSAWSYTHVKNLLDLFDR